MCIAIHKPAGVDLPSKATLKNCFTNNSDGAGFAFLRPGAKKIEISKGYMSFGHFWHTYQSLNLSKQDVIVYHFRIATSGGVNPNNCHPFPLSKNDNDLKALSIKSDCVIAHNGIIGQGQDNLSDTMLFVRDIAGLSPNQLFNPALRPLLLRTTEGSKMIILSPSKVLLLGDFIEDGEIYYSNTSYRTKKFNVYEYKGIDKGHYYPAFSWDYDKEDYTFSEKPEKPEKSNPYIIPCPYCNSDLTEEYIYTCDNCNQVFAEEEIF